MATYFPLWCKSNFSFLRASSHPEELVRTATDLGLPGIALTDLDSLAGVVAAHQETEAASERSKRHRHLIIGTELTVESGDRRGRILLLAQNRRGYRSVSTLISRGRLRSPKGESRVPVADVRELAEDVILIWTYASGDGSLYESLADSFEGRAYLGVSRHFRPADLERERRLRTLADRFSLPVVALPEVLYHEPDRRRLLDVMRCIDHSSSLEEAGEWLEINALHALPSPAVMERAYGDQPEWIARTFEIAERCSFSLAEIEYRYPSEARPDGYSDVSWLRELTHRGARERYPQSVPPTVREQLDRELTLIEELDYAGYFLTMAEIVRYCREHGILCQGRGSAANSAVCFCLGITAVDPVKVNLLFERFLSRERAEPPDIDLDIEHRRREEVIQHVYERYGRDRAAMLANVVRFRRRSAIREVGKAFGFPETTLDQISKLLSHRGMSIPEAVEQSPLEVEQPAITAFLEICEQILDMPRHLSIHPGGFLLGREPVSHIVPIENAAMPERTVIQWDKYAVEEMNLFKVDLLGLGALTHLDYAFRLLREQLGVSFSMATIPADCRRTYAMLRRADTVGVFQLESRAQMAMLPRLKPRVYYDIVIEISIVRPGPITGGMVHPYLRRRAGEESVEYPHPDLEQVLSKTLGVPLFQEQVMKLAVVAADYSPGEADQLRRDMAAWRHSGRIEQHHERLVQRMIAKGIEREFAERVFEQIRGFGEYGFPESHAASFALIAYATAWLRANYPVVFTCALLQAWPMGFYSPASIVADAIRHGITVLPVDVLESDWECCLVPDPEHPRRQGDRGLAIRMGLRYVRGISLGDWERIRAARRAGAITLQAFLDRARLPRDVMITLTEAGAFAPLGQGRRETAWDVFARHWSEAAQEGGLASHPSEGDGRVPAESGAAGAGAGAGVGNTTTADASVHSVTVRSAEWQPEEVAFRELSFAERILWDYRSSAHSTEGHPLEPFRDWLRRHGNPSAAEVRRMPHGTGIAYIGMVICRQRPETASGTVFFTLEDETGYVNLIVWKRQYQELRPILVTASILGVRGVLQSDGSTVHLVVTDAWKPSLPERAAAQRSRDFR